MGTRQLRLNDSVQIRKRIQEFVGKTISIVLTDNTAMFGVLEKADESKIVLKNMRMKNVSYTFDKIAEVYFDTNA
ncbi:hypothetical protein [Ohtaekwangia koreensis]|jgi:small nuclear ribonucleoprotein (snRNP)-like protein|uniref:LSM domain-containing protein n=1 Tax=Ohtaekwangia koreensis TaxID=688867 RepID=A0A1T5IV64_9BACT|nr:hypothetical protein [Ohtaekwangia koreensis]SKC43099.1 hypothetical protein SAMN05660236_0447 [Ohtaekwangia koreensis]